MALSTAYIVSLKSSVTICFGKPYKIKTDDLTEANEELMGKVTKLILIGVNTYYCVGNCEMFYSIRLHRNFLEVGR